MGLEKHMHKSTDSISGCQVKLHGVICDFEQNHLKQCFLVFIFLGHRYVLLRYNMVLHAHVHGSITYNSQEVKITNMSTDE